MDVVPTDDEPKKIESESNEVSKEEPIEETDEEKKEKVVEAADTDKSDLSEFTEQKIFDDLIELQQSGKCDMTKSGKKTFRTALEEKYNLKKKAFKKHDAFVAAFDRFGEKMLEEADKEENSKEEAEN